ncbi:MAG: bifunctional riboflavin kinase/FAD synthetase [Clostridia bacterium]|nr:bifunctional riboflavin kinase/FAD synthetase [Clostridia bacterium]
MKIIDLKNRIEIKKCSAPLCLILGNFDGIHLGHLKLIKKAVSEGKKLGLKIGVWTFKEHPMNTLSGKKNTFLTSNEEKNEIFAENGLDYAIYEDFDTVRGYTPEQFVEIILTQKLDCRLAVFGFNFRFGRNRTGTPEILSQLFRKSGRTVIVAEAVKTDTGIISSTSIRDAIEKGEIEKANEMLGRTYSINLPVVYGKQLGRTIGIPTINQTIPSDKVKPKNGIYASKCLIDGKAFMGVSNIGFRPTVNNDVCDINCETHIIGYEGCLYEKTVKVSFYKKLRDEQKFDGVEELKKAIEKDILSVREYFSKRQGN